MKRIAPTRTSEYELNKAGYRYVAGIDEVGRGSWAGPVVAAAVILPDVVDLARVRDSKMLSSIQRARIGVEIKRVALGIGLGWVASGEIDAHGLSWAVHQNGLRALQDLGREFDAVLLDGTINYLRDDCYAIAAIGADATTLSVAAASIIAKVARDQYMDRMHILYPAYGFNSHKGYGTRSHQAALQLTVSPMHRASFRPVRDALANRV